MGYPDGEKGTCEKFRGNLSLFSCLKEARVDYCHARVDSNN